MKKINPIHISGVPLMAGDKPRGMSIVGLGSLGNAMITTGKSTKPDHLSFSEHGNRDGKIVLAIQRLFRGRYGDAYVYADDLLAALKKIGSRQAGELEYYMEGWRKPFKAFS